MRFYVKTKKNRTFTEIFLKNLYFSTDLATKIEDIALSYVQNLGWRGVIHLLEVFGDAQSVFAASQSELLHKAELKEEFAKRILSKNSFSIAKKELSHCLKNGVTPIVSTEDGYPERLRFTEAYPHIIYMVGESSLLHRSTIITFTGEKEVSAYGEKTIVKLIEQIAETAPEVVLATTIGDGAGSIIARVALHYGLRVIGITGSSLPYVSSQNSMTLSQEILDAGGVIVSCTGVMAHKEFENSGAHYSLAAGISDAVVVIESEGIHPIAQAADGYNREIFAIPGRISDSLSQGTNRMIAIGIAQMTYSGKDIIKKLGLEEICL